MEKFLNIYNKRKCTYGRELTPLSKRDFTQFDGVELIFK